MESPFHQMQKKDLNHEKRWEQSSCLTLKITLEQREQPRNET